MKNPFRRAKSELPKVEKRFCSKGHEVPYGEAVVFRFTDVMPEPLCPYCFKEVK